MKKSQLIKQRYMVSIDDVKRLVVKAKVDVDGIREFVEMKNISVIGFTADSIVLKGTCEYGTFYETLNPLMLSILLTPSHKDHAITQNRLWNPTVFVSRIKI